MSDASGLYQRRITRAMLGARAVSLAGDIDVTAMDGFCQQLAQYDEALALLHEHGFGPLGQSLVQLVRAAIDAAKGTP